VKCLCSLVVAFCAQLRACVSVSAAVLWWNSDNTRQAYTLLKRAAGRPVAKLAAAGDSTHTVPTCPSNAGLEGISAEWP